ncbi:MAG TPA: response regulator [Nitrospiraceae bacterium]|nr:response regulator [Nitrospiraceae bacterium]
MTNQNITIAESSYVLVVDDDEATRYALPQLIRHHRPMLLVETAGSVDETIQLLAERNFLTIVSDVRMPKEDGIRLIRRVREKGYRIPVIVMTADVTETIEDQSFAAGAYAFLRKPLIAKQFLDALDYAVHYPRTALY